MILEKAYWLRRKRASLSSAQNAAGCTARLDHYDLSGRYSLKAGDILPPPICSLRIKPAYGDID